MSSKSKKVYLFFVNLLVKNCRYREEMSGAAGVKTINFPKVWSGYSKSSSFEASNFQKKKYFFSLLYKIHTSARTYGFKR